MLVAGGDLSFAFDDDVVNVAIVVKILETQINAGDGARESVGDEDLGMVAVIADGEIPGPVEEFGAGENLHHVAVTIDDGQRALADVGFLIADLRAHA